MTSCQVKQSLFAAIQVGVTNFLLWTSESGCRNPDFSVEQQKPRNFCVFFATSFHM